MRFHAEPESVKQIKVFYNGVARGDFTAACALLDPDIEWREPNVLALWFRGTHYGAEAVRKEVLDPMASKLAGLEMRMKKFFEVGEHVIAIGHYHGRSKATAKELEAASAHIWTLRNGRPVRFEAYHDDTKWLELAKEATRPEKRLAA
jgi:ketosteroid isomerase-like protein